MQRQIMKRAYERFCARGQDDGHEKIGRVGDLGPGHLAYREGVRSSASVPDQLALFSLRSGQPFAARVAKALGRPLAAHEEREFEWGQHKCRPLDSVRGRDVYVVQSLHGDVEQSVNDKLCRLLFFLGALADAGADRLTAVVPFLCYSRKDRQTQARDPVTTRYVARLFEAVGVSRVVTLDVHNLAAFQNAFRCETVHLEAHHLFAEVFARRPGSEVVVMSPDVGGVKRADRFGDALGRRLGTPPARGFIEKRRSQDVVSGDAVIGTVAGRTVILVDDMVSGGTTLARAASACRAAGAREVVAAVTHGAFVPAASAVLAAAPISQIAILDHIPPFALDEAVVRDKLTIVGGSGLIADVIGRLHEGGSVVDLLTGA
jgi:ribose-phosphate pyrophosphokinase